MKLTLESSCFSSLRLENMHGYIQDAMCTRMWHLKFRTVENCQNCACQVFAPFSRNLSVPSLKSPSPTHIPPRHLSLRSLPQKHRRAYIRNTQLSYMGAVISQYRTPLSTEPLCNLRKRFITIWMTNMSSPRVQTFNSLITSME